MRKYALIVALLCGFGFYYATSEMQMLEPVPPGISISEYTRYPAGRWELARYAAAAIGGIAALLALFPEGR